MVVSAGNEHDLSDDPLDGDSCCLRLIGEGFQALCVPGAKGWRFCRCRPALVEWHIVNRRTLPGPMRRHLAIEVDASPHMRRWCERYHCIDPWVTGGDAQGCLCAEGCADNGQVVGFSSKVIESAAELALTRFGGQVDYAAWAVLWWWIIVASYSAGVR